MLSKIYYGAGLVLSILTLKVDITSAQLINSSGKNDNKIWVQIELSKSLNPDSCNLGFENVDFVNKPNFTRVKPNINGRLATWQISTDKPILMDLSNFLGSEYGLMLGEPGDSILVATRENVRITGSGSKKHYVLSSMKVRSQSIKVPKNPRLTSILSVKDYEDWVDYINKKERLVDSIFNPQVNGLSRFANTYLKAKSLCELEYVKLLRFASLSGNPKLFNLTGSQLNSLFDATFGNPESKWLVNYSGETYYFYNFYEYVRQSTLRKVNFNLSDPSVSGINRTINYYNEAKFLLKGSALKNCLTFLITEKGIKEHTYKKGYLQGFEDLLAKYYREIQDKRHIKFTEEFDEKIHNWLTGLGTTGYNFDLSDVNGKSVTKDSFRGKLLILNFWKSDCKKCEVTNQALIKIQQQFSDSKGIAFVNISVDQDKQKWTNTLKVQGSNDFGINLYTSGLGTKHPVIRGYNVTDYPALFLYDGNGKSLVIPNNPEFANGLEKDRFPDPLKEDGKPLSDRIKREIPLLSDGPYIFYKKDSVKTFNIASGNEVREIYNPKPPINFVVQTDEFKKTFKVAFKKDQKLEVSIYDKPGKLIALSDIEGNFVAFRKLLQSNGIIDANYNWVFGKGHLVFAGDMFDRGQQVTECLWLIYSLEEKAKAEGGYVHFVLGNHEIMNLQGDHRYVEPKYESSAKLIGKTLTQLYGEDSELGRWLRTKNVVEKIGDLLFAHGGISPQLNKSGINISDINKLARPQYAINKTDYGNVNTNLVMSQKYGPFWYRGYYDPKNYAAAAVDSVLAKYNAKHIITGHTIVADTISVLYNNKVINTDTSHAKGKSEALLVEGKSFYRVNDKGQRRLLFKDDEKVIDK